MAKSKQPEPHHTIEFHIYKVDGFRRPDDAFQVRFYDACVLHNIMVSEARKRITTLEDNKLYTALLHKYGRLRSVDAEDKRLKELSSVMSSIRKEYGLSQTDFERYLKVAGRKYKKVLSSQQVQKEADRVWQAAEKVLFGNGKTVHFRKPAQYMSISQKTCTNGIKVNLYNGDCTWNGLRFHVHINRSELYVAESLLSDPCFFEIKRRMFPTGWRYYLTVVLKGLAPRKINSIDRQITDIGGIDPGTSTIAFVSDSRVILSRLAPRSNTYSRTIRHLQKEADRLIRIANPDNYNTNGTCRKGKHKWKVSKRVQRLRRSIQSLHRQKTAYIRQAHHEIANQIVRSCGILYIEPTSFKSLQKKAKQTQRSDKISAIRKKDGTIQTVCKYKRKKRFGHSMNEHAPSELITIIKQKCQQYKIDVQETNTRTMRASQYNPVTGEYESSALNIRMKNINGHEIQRDLLSAYITAHADDSLNHPDATRCLQDWSKFISLHDHEINRMKGEGISFKQCFGF